MMGQRPEVTSSFLCDPALSGEKGNVLKQRIIREIGMLLIFPDESKKFVPLWGIFFVSVS